MKVIKKLKKIFSRKEETKIENKNEKNKCDQCGEIITNESNMIQTEVYNSAFDTESETLYFCDEECESNFFDDGETYFFCERCNRNVIRQVGYNSHYRVVNGETMCVQCYQEEILKNGMHKESFEGSMISGMFFNRGNKEVLSVGFKEYKSVFVTGTKTAEELNKELKELNETQKIVIAFENLSIIGNEGHIIIYIKDRETKTIKL